MNAQTEHYVADAAQMLDEMKKLMKAGITISAFCSTHAKPRIYVQNTDQLTKYIMDKDVKTYQVTKQEAETYLIENGVIIAWVETRPENSQRMH